ncbi:MAG: B12-binding domain-containing radical SAM protein [Sedimentisphaerales bacterium]|nr:B12-binding domain-containing radical SAM protein [Sedimentisphaerales bacterium]
MPLNPEIILVADRTLSANYSIIFEGMFGTMQTTFVPELVMKMLMAPKMPADLNGRALAVPLGLRRVEAALRAELSLSSDNIVCATPETLPQLLSDNTRLVMVSSSDPLGRGMSNTTTTSFWPGRLYTEFWTDKMMTALAAAKQKLKFKIAVGGAGSWQWHQDLQACRRHGIDAICHGYFENGGPQFIDQILKDNIHSELIESSGIAVFNSKKCAVEKIRPIMGPSMLGIVELSRGCGKACNFCPMSDKKMEHLSPELIWQDIETNVRGGFRNVVSGSEDFLRYGATDGFKPNFNAICNLLEGMRKIPNKNFLQIDHVNVSSVLQFDDQQLKSLRELMNWESRCDYLWVNMGAETASPRLIKENCPGKALPFDVENWPEMIIEATDKLIRTGFFPVMSFVLGLPGETPDEVKATLALVRELCKRRLVIFPIFFEPAEPALRTKSPAFGVKTMTRDHLELYAACYEQNFKEVPPMFWDNQRAGGVSLAKRALIRTLGTTEVIKWRGAFRKLRKELP